MARGRAGPQPIRGLGKSPRGCVGVTLERWRPNCSEWFETPSFQRSATEMAPLHENLAAGRWHTLELVEQLANIGREVGRALRAAAAGRAERRDLALNRALELFGSLTAWDAHE